MTVKPIKFRQFLVPLLLLGGACCWVAMDPAVRLATPPAAAPAAGPDFQPIASLQVEPREPQRPQLATGTLPAANAESHPLGQIPLRTGVSVLESDLPTAAVDNSASAQLMSARQPARQPSPHTFLESPALPAGQAFPNTLPRASGAGMERTPASEVVPTDFSVLGNREPGPRRESTIPSFDSAKPLPSPTAPTVLNYFPAFPEQKLALEPNLSTTAAPAPLNSSTPPGEPPAPATNPATSYLLQSFKPPRTTDGCEVQPTIDDFSAPPTDFDSFNPSADMQIYQGKQLYATQRPLLELGRPWYQLGQLPPPQSWLGQHNPVSQQFLVFGDIRTAAAANQLGGNSKSLLAWQSNLFFDWRLTGTERFHFNMTPNTQGANSSRYLFDDDDFISEFNGDINFGFFEGDLGAIVGGWTNKTLPFDLPIALGVMPLVIQNGVWLEDAFLGAAMTLPARNSPLLDISNYDVTFFAGWDKLDSPAFGADDNAAKLYGVASWIEALNGYIEADYAFVEDRDSVRDRSYHNIGLGYTRRFGHLLSNSTRVIVNAGQSTLGGPNTADGVLLLSENSLITANPSTILPYFNLFAGFDRPQSVGRAGVAGGILRNTGILFESDNLTGYPTLDATANQTYGMAMGLSLMPQNFNQQLVLEGAMLGVMGDDVGRNAAAAQRGVGFRYQLPLNNSIIFRVDGMYGFLAETEDISGLRVELRRKF